MKKIGILNFQYSAHNYGAVLQAAALEYICRQLGHDPRHLDFIPRPKVTVKGGAGKLLRKMGLRKVPKAIHFANEKAFERFRQTFLTRTRPIKSRREFSGVAKCFDSVVVGSDQVWRPTFANDIMAFFLGYVPKGVNRIAYAASFGTATWEKTDDKFLTARVQEELLQFKAVSCREESGVEICKNVFGVRAVHVLDPLLLVDEPFFENVVSNSSVRSRTKLVYYKLDSTPDFQEDLKVVGAELGCDAVNIYFKDSDVPEYREVSDWLALIRNSEVVITDSFHCICLALRFGKEVIYCPNVSRGQTRLDSLFRKLNIEVEPLSFDLKTSMWKLYGNSGVEAVLEVERKESIRFLSDAIRE
ncbi:polysaccharide pyruvyl transferase family protein [Marinobacter confluentis]|uniref:Polysaccharide pyruvyl transferase family protein n=1 Tax=Marinobacter confluentis TaxID=1697557 RepID=A0A4Z1C3L9_9GAMM|nr:polysaccharide pyruvyl transferase family protein [Marinobacter confluentis]TGN39940.1 polysaccharide pyruvyl transferase family protein [Marinobacter confluentis]